MCPGKGCNNRTNEIWIGLCPGTGYNVQHWRKIAGCACAGNAGNVFPVTAGWRSRHATRHVRDARAVMHVGIANQRFPLKLGGGENVPGIPGACATRNFTYLVRGPCEATSGTPLSVLQTVFGRHIYPETYLEMYYQTRHSDSELTGLRPTQRKPQNISWRRHDMKTFSH